MKYRKGIPLEEILERKLKNPQFRIRFEERRFYLQAGRLISDLRKKVGMTQSQLAAASGLSQPMIGRIETGDQRRVPTFSTMYRILLALGFDMEIKVKPIKKSAA